MKSKVLFLAFAACLFSPVSPANADPLLLCGGDEVFSISPESFAEGKPAKLWSWQARDQKALPDALQTTFGTTDDCKPIHDGRQILITSSGGGCALVDYPSGEVKWFARVTNAHSIELLPGNRVVVASSTGATGNSLKLFDLSRNEEPIGSTPLLSAHGVVWDAEREALWALGFDELRRYRLEAWDSASPSLTLDKTFPLPDDGGHDLQPVPGTGDLIVTTHATVQLFDRDQGLFRPHPELGSRARVKAVTIHPMTGKLYFVQAIDSDRWWSDTIQSPTAPTSLTVSGERLYKARWFPASRP